MATTLLEQDLLLINPEQFRHLVALPDLVENGHFLAELHLVNQVVARRVLGATLFEEVEQELQTAMAETSAISALLKVLRPALASWAYVYALPNFHHLLPIVPTMADAEIGRHFDQQRQQARQNAEAWTQQVVALLQSAPELYGHYQVSSAAKAYTGSPKMI